MDGDASEASTQNNEGTADPDQAGANEEDDDDDDDGWGELEEDLEAELEKAAREEAENG